MSNKQFEPNEITNNNNIEPPFKKKYTILEVTEEAERLAAKFNNPKWVGFYSKSIYWLGKDRIHEIEGRISDSEYASPLFSKILKQENDSAQKKTLKDHKMSQMRSENGSSES